MPNTIHDPKITAQYITYQILYMIQKLLPSTLHAKSDVAGLFIILALNGISHIWLHS
jgi:hypothetical protein